MCGAAQASQSQSVNNSSYQMADPGLDEGSSGVSDAGLQGDNADVQQVSDTSQGNHCHGGKGAGDDNSSADNLQNVSWRGGNHRADTVGKPDGGSGDSSVKDDVNQFVSDVSDTINGDDTGVSQTDAQNVDGAQASLKTDLKQIVDQFVQKLIDKVTGGKGVDPSVKKEIDKMVEDLVSKLAGAQGADGANAADGADGASPVSAADGTDPVDGADSSEGTSPGNVQTVAATDTQNVDGADDDKTKLKADLKETIDKFVNDLIDKLTSSKKTSAVSGDQSSFSVQNAAWHNKANIFAGQDTVQA